MVLRKTLGSIVDPIYGKLGQNWEVPYIVTGATWTVDYYLLDQEGNLTLNPWNITNLRKSIKHFANLEFVQKWES